MGAEQCRCLPGWVARGCRGFNWLNWTGSLWRSSGLDGLDSRCVAMADSCTSGRDGRRFHKYEWAGRYGMNCNEPDQPIRHARPNSGSSYMGKAVGRVAPLDFPYHGWQMEAFRALSKRCIAFEQRCAYRVVHVRCCCHAHLPTFTLWPVNAHPPQLGTRSAETPLGQHLPRMT
jgi:hypothetical protein